MSGKKLTKKSYAALASTSLRLGSLKIDKHVFVLPSLGICSFLVRMLVGPQTQEPNTRCCVAA
jgi:hypothetical protein